MAIDLAKLSEYPVVSVDVETTGLYWHRDKMFGVAVAAHDGKKTHSQYWDIRTNPGVLVALRRELPKCKKVVNHNIKFDAHFLKNENIQIRDDAMECTMVRAALIDEHRKSHSLDSICMDLFGVGKAVHIYQKLADMFGGNPTRDVQMRNLHRASESLVREYAVPDPELAIKLWLWQEEEIERQGLHKVWSLERELTPVLVAIERGGVRVDEDRAAKSIIDMDKMVYKYQKLLGTVNVNSSQQMRKLLEVHKRENGRWYTGSGQLLNNTDGGEASIDAETLRLLTELGDKHASSALAIRKLVKGKSFLKDHILGHSIDGYVYPNYNQTKGDNDLGTGTGRFSINDPALQQIPKRDREIAAIVRACFLSDKGDDWNSADWDTFEFRWFAHYVDVPRINEAYHKNPATDFHQLVADLTGLPRKARYAGDANAKQINLGLVFGMGEGTMAEEMGLDFTMEARDGTEYKKAGDKAKAIFAQYHEAVPGVKELLRQASNIARSRGYVKTICDRHIRFPGGKFTHKAAGLVFQGSSADCMKRKMIELWHLGNKMGFRYLLSVHDENNTSVPKSKSALISKAIKKELEAFGDGDPIKCNIPIRVSIGTGPNWWESSK